MLPAILDMLLVLAVIALGLRLSALERRVDDLEGPPPGTHRAPPARWPARPLPPLHR